ncbi:MAG: VWA domain-containing protein [Bryobacteraceae bacterium]|nr:VWA domain-containing protein [Bryobacteraceae bacterium]
MRLLAVILALTLTAGSQETDFRISVTTNLVIVNVDARDKSGKPIPGLKAADFVVTEDGKPQKISVFEYQELETEGEPAPAIAAAAPSREQITSPPPGSVRYRDRRLMVLFFDFSSMPPADQIRAQEAALKFVDQQMSPADLVSILSFSTSLKVLEDFTSDRDRLREVIGGFRIGESSELAAAGLVEGDDNAEDTGDAFSADEGEFNIFNTDRKLGALESAAKMLSALPEKKALIYFSSGVGKTGAENQSQLRATVNAAVRANVAFYPIDARGLMASAPAGDASKGAPKGQGLFSGETQRSARVKFNDEQETLHTLAGDTGGKAMLDTNDLTQGIRQAQRDISSYYILGYYSTNEARDGRYRRVKVSVAKNLQARLDYRSGYFAGKDFKDFNSSDKERQLEEALMLGDPLTDLPIALEVNYFRISRDEYFVPVAAKIPGSAVELARSGKAQQAELDFIGQVRDSKGRLAGSVRDMIKVKLDGENAGKLGRRNLGYDSGFTLGPGEYSIRFLARENVTGKMGTFETKFTVPDVTSESRWLRTSSVVWANQREPLSAAVGAANKDKKLASRHPLVEGAQKLVPSITRVYRRDQNLYVYVEVYDAAETPAPNVAASLSFFRGRQKAFDTKEVRVDRPLAGRPGALPVRFQVPLQSMKAGRYTCQLNLVDERGQKFLFARAPMILVD